jgi:hypothetical protein
VAGIAGHDDMVNTFFGGIVPGRKLYDVTNHSSKRELEDLILEQIYVLKQAAVMTDCDIFEFHLRHYQIMMLFR